MTQNKDLYARLKSGPAILLLGQDYLSLETGVDPLLSEIIRKYGQSNSNAFGYYQILGNDASKSIDSALAWMQERCKHFSVPVWLETVAQFAWSGVQTSAIDIIWQRAFKTNWRELEPIYTEDKDPVDARSRTKLHCTYLFGTVDQIGIEQRAPLTRQEFNRRRQVAVGLARRIPRLVTPFGTLIIEGFSLDKDWFSISDLSVILDDLSEGQVHLFHSPDNIDDYPDIIPLVESGKLVLHSQSLASFLKQGEDFLQLGTRPEGDNQGYSIRIQDNVVTVPLPLWNQVSRSAIVLDEATFTQVPAISNERRYNEFRSFLARSGERPIWSAYVRNFAFKRDFEDALFKLIVTALEDKDLAEEPIILHGQSGVGKTVALGALAHRVKQTNHPVLFIERRPLRPNLSDVDAFVEWAEQNGASTSLVIWDGMLEYEQYYEFLQSLTGRGRKVTLVGSTYRVFAEEDGLGRRGRSSRKRQGSKLIEAPAELSEGEISRFETFLTGLIPDIGGIKSLMVQYGAKFFVALYRLLPQTRHQLRSGINLEVAYSEEQIKQFAETMGRKISSDPTIFETPLAFALAKAGFVSSEPVFGTNKEEIGGELLNQIQQLIGLVMIPGQFGLRVPIDLLLRTLRHNAHIDLVSILNQTDIFSWDSDAVGNILIGPRHALEAELISKTRLGGAKYEIDFVAALIRNINAGDVEVQFAIDLVRKINPPNEDAPTNFYGPHLLMIANAFTYTREVRGVLNPRLMLQETNLLREAAKQQQLEPLSSDYQSLLDRAEKVVNSALEILEREHANPGLRSQLLVELAATLGARAKQLYAINPQASSQLYLHLQQYLFEARIISRENFYPIDVLFWTTQDLVRAESVSEIMKLDAQAELRNIFDMAQLEETFSSQERFQKRRQQLGMLLHDIQMSEDAFNQLEKQGSTAGYVLRAIQIAGEIPKDRLPSSNELKRVRESVSFLESNRMRISQDGRAMQLLLRNWWLANTGHPIFWKERQTLSFELEDWRTCFNILNDILRSNEIYRTPIIRYLTGISLFHLGSYDNAATYFRELERDTSVKGPRRIQRSYLVSTPEGLPRKFSGTVDWLNAPQKQGEIYIPELRRRIPFIPDNFRRSDLVKGSAVNDFHIAFNFLGFIADPAGYYEYSERQAKS